jgi:hypothetical protein
MHAETMVVSMVIQQVVSQQPHQNHIIFTDCKNLVYAVQNRSDVAPASWRAEEEIIRLRQILITCATSTQIQYAHRKHLIAAHNLANLARRKGWNYQGVPTDEILAEHSIPQSLDRNVFRVVNDDGG